MTPPKNTKDVREFIGIVNYYMYVWDRRSHLLHPLTALTSHMVKFKCTDMEKKAFDEIKRTVAHKTLLAYPDFNKLFDVHKYISGYQLGLVIIQNGKPIAFYSRKWTKTKTWYTVIGKELLGIVKIVK